MTGVWTDLRFVIYSADVELVRFSPEQSERSRAGIGFDVARAETIQAESGWVAGEFKTQDGEFRKVYSQPRGFPQQFHWARREANGEAQYLIDADETAGLPIQPMSTSGPFVLIEIALPQQDISWQFPDDYPGPVMEEVPLTEAQRVAIETAIAPAKGQLYDVPFLPLITSPVRFRDLLIARLKVLAPVE